MQRFLSLLNVCRKNVSFFGFKNKKDRAMSKKRKVGPYILLALCLLYLAWIFLAMAMSFIQATEPGQERLIASGFLNLEILVLSILIGLTQVPSLLFFSRDIEAFLTMPFKAGELFLAKLASVYLYLLATTLYIGIPIGVGYLVVDFSFSGLLGWIFNLLFLPLWPACLMSLIFLLILQFLPFLRNKERMNVFTGIFALLAIIGFYIAFGFLPGLSDLSNGTEMNLTFSTLAAVNHARWIFPTLVGSMKMIGGGWNGLLQGILINLALSLAFLAALYFLAQGLYFRLVLSIGSSSTKEKNLSKKDQIKAIEKVKSPFFALVQWEFHLLFRTSAYFMNVVIASFFVPLWIIFIMAVPIFKNWQNIQSLGISRSALGSFAREFIINLGNPSVIGILIGAGLAIFALLSGATATAVSRDAIHIESYKSMPLRAQKVFMAEFIPSYIVAIFPIGLISLILLILMGFWPVFAIPLLFSFILTSLAVGLVDFITDVHSPNLDWSEEIKAVKQGKQTFIAFIIHMAAIFFLILICVFLGTHLWVAALAILLIDLALLAFTAYDISSKAEKYFSRYNRF